MSIDPKTGMPDEDDDEMVSVTLSDDDGDEGEGQGGVPGLEPAYKVKVNGEDGGDDDPGASDKRGEDGTRGEDHSDETEEEKRERRRKERREKNERKKFYKKRDELVIQSLQEENKAIRESLAQFQKKMSERETSDLESQHAHWKREAQRAAAAKQQAIQDGDGARFQQAEQYERQAYQRVNHIEQMRRQPAPAPQQSQGVDPTVKEYAGQFMKRFDWYDPNGTDETSKVVQLLDNGVARDGYDPRSPEYWEELEARMKRRLPQTLFPKDDGGDDDDDEGAPPAKTEPKRRGPPVAGKADAKSGKSITIPREFRAALEEAGIWDDPKRRDRAIRSYLESTKENRT